MSAIHHTPEWRRIAKARLQIARDRDEPCCRCGYPIDYTLSGMHRWGPQVDHLTPAALAPHLAYDVRNTAVAHRACNHRHGSRLGGAVAKARAQQRAAQRPGASRAWVR